MWLTSFIKAWHIIFVVTWFAALFYTPRLFVYFAETIDKPEPERNILQREYQRMMRLLWYGISIPSAVMTFFLGMAMLYFWGFQSWLILKLCFVAGLYAYHFACQSIMNQQLRGEIRYSGYRLRMWNEVATLFLVSIVFLVTFKNALSLLWGLGGLLALIGAILGGIRAYKYFREAQP